MNTGAEAVESGIKVARKWGHDVEGVDEPEHHRGRRQLPRPDHHDHQLLRRPGRPRTDTAPTRPASAPCRTATPAAAAAAIDENTVAVLIEPIQGEAGIIVPPGGLPAAAAGAVHRAPGAADLRRDPVRPRPHRADVRRATTSASSPTSICWARRSVVAWYRSRPWWATATCSACSDPVSTARPSAVTRWRRRSVPAWSGCWRPGTSSGAAAELGARLHGRAGDPGRGTA